MTGAARRAVACLLPLLGAAGWLGCRSGAPPPASAAVAAWAEGPALWLILPDEEKQIRRIRSNQEAVAFMEAFWRRRDPDPERPGNPFVQTFYQRVEAADRLYGEPGLRGSLTDRGRALVLLGPQPSLAVGQKPVAAWDPGRPGGRPVAETRKVKVESWTYELADLPPALAALWKEEEHGAPATLTFAVEPHGTTLIAGGKILDLAARAAVRPPTP